MALSQARKDNKNKALVVMASGLGKTLTAIFDIKNYLSELEKSKPEAQPRVLILCHSADILRQTKEIFKREFGDEYSYGLYNSLEKARRRTDFLFANLQSVYSHKEDFKPREFSYVAVDEAHHSVAITYIKAITYFKPSFLLGLTATPDRKDGNPIEAVFGEAVYSMSLVDAVDAGLLSKVRYNIEIDENNQEILHSLAKEHRSISFYTLNEYLHGNYISYGDIAEKIVAYQEKMDDPTTVIFCPRITHVEAVASIMPNAATIHSKTAPGHNSEVLESFRKGEIKTLITVDMLNEGIDVPRTDLIVFLRSTNSGVLFQQQLGRGLRLQDGKDKVHVLDFVCNATRLEEIMGIREDLQNKRGGDRNYEDDGDGSDFEIRVEGVKYESLLTDVIEVLRGLKARASYISEWRKFSKEEVRERIIKAFHAYREKYQEDPVATKWSLLEIPNIPALSTLLGEDLTFNSLMEMAFGYARTHDWTIEMADEVFDRLIEHFHCMPTLKEAMEYAKQEGFCIPRNNILQQLYGGTWVYVFYLKGYSGHKGIVWETEEIKVALEKVYEHFGRIPSIDEYRAFSQEHRGMFPSGEAIKGVLGCTFVRAFAELGITGKQVYRTTGIKFTKEDVKSALEKVAMFYGVDNVTQEQYIEYRNRHLDEKLPSIWKIESLFGSTWTEVLKCADMKQPNTWTLFDIARYMIDCGIHCNKESISIKDYVDYYQDSGIDIYPRPGTIIRHFDQKWNKAKLYCQMKKPNYKNPGEVELAMKGRRELSAYFAVHLEEAEKIKWQEVLEQTEGWLYAKE